jgi:adenylate cyclase
MGDAIMAIFGLVSNEEECHSKQAVCAGLEMLERLEKHNAQRMQGNPDTRALKLGVGIHTGEVVAGYVGSHDRLEFTVLGQNVNLAARIEGQTKLPAPPLLFSQEVADKIASKIEIQEVLTAKLKGVSEPVKLFSVKSVVSSFN